MKPDSNQLDLFANPCMATVIQERQPDGALLLRPGKVVSLESEVGTREFARLTGVSQSHVVGLCDQGIIRARKMTPCGKSKWLIPRSEVARFRTGTA